MQLRCATCVDRKWSETQRLRFERMSENRFGSIITESGSARNTAISQIQRFGERALVSQAGVGVDLDWGAL